LKAAVPSGAEYAALKKKIEQHNLHTICSEARCPNRGECWSAGTATFLLLGPVCTRACRYCHVESGPAAPVNPDEPEAIADTAAALDLKYVVITSVTRDDLPDGGAAHFAETIRALKNKIDRVRIEVLTPDFAGDIDSVRKVADESPFVFGHNIETVEALFPRLRPAGSFSRSVDLLGYIKKSYPRQLTKSGIMLGLGETDSQISAALSALREAGVDRVTLGQYLQPSKNLEPVSRFITPEEFEHWETEARSIGFKWVKSGPLVRSSFRADAET